MLNRIRIVLVETSHPGNIGSAARAMKTMGLNKLVLVTPLSYPHPKAFELAAGADDILKQAKIVESLDNAIADCSLTIATSARMRRIPWPLVTPREMVKLIQEKPKNSEIAIVFGPEQSGLSNHALQRCHVHVQIPTDADYASLNIAAAVQVIAYELRIGMLGEEAAETTHEFPAASIDEMEKFFQHLQYVLMEIDFLKIDAPRQLMTRMRRLFMRAQLDVMEVNMLRGMLTAIQKSK